MRRGLVILLALVGLVVGWVVAGSWSGDDAVDDLLAGYGAAIREGRLDEARTRHTSAAYRERTSPLRFRTGHVRDADELGPLQRLRATGDGREHVRDAEGRELLRVPVLWEGERGTATTVFDLVDEDGALRIDRTWTWPDDGLGYERVW